MQRTALKTNQQKTKNKEQRTKNNSTNQQSSNQQRTKNKSTIFKSTKNKPVWRPAGDRSTNFTLSGVEGEQINKKQKTNQQASNQQRTKNKEQINKEQKTKNKPVWRPMGDRSTTTNRNPYYSNSYYNPKKYLTLLKILGQWKSSTTEIQKLPY